MGPNTNKTLSVEEQNEFFCAVDTVALQIKAMEKFIARRFDEISMEINATAQQVDMAEDGIIRRFSEILETLGAISYSGNGRSAANSGVELQAVIDDTENAANRILDAADRIVDYVSNDTNWNEPDKREILRNKIQNDIQEILLACTFQDLTGQRIRNTLNNLHEIESRISSTFERLGINITPPAEAIEHHIHKAANQAEIDALLNDMQSDKTS